MISHEVCEWTLLGYVLKTEKSGSFCQPWILRNNVKRSGKTQQFCKSVLLLGERGELAFMARRVQHCTVLKQQNENLFQKNPNNTNQAFV